MKKKTLFSAAMALTFFAPMTALASCGTTTSQKAPSLISNDKKSKKFTLGGELVYDHVLYQAVDTEEDDHYCIAIKPEGILAGDEITVHSEVGFESYNRPCVGIASNFLTSSDLGQYIGTINIIVKNTEKHNIYDISKNAFKNAKRLQKVQIQLASGEPIAKVSIGNSAFEGANKFITFTADPTINITKIGNHAFSWCEHLQKVVFPNNVTEIDSYAFEHCFCLRSINIPANTLIKNDVFVECVSLTDFSGEGRTPGLTFNGTKNEWAHNSRYVGWYSEINATKIKCSDGIIDVDYGCRFKDYEFSYNSETKTASITRYSNQQDKIVYVPSFVVNNDETYLINTIGSNAFKIVLLKQSRCETL